MAVHMAMILAVAGGAVTHQIQDPLGLTHFPTQVLTHLAVGTAVVLMVAVRLMIGKPSQTDANIMRFL